MNKKLLTAAPLIQGGCSDNSAKLQRVGKTSGLTCLDNCLINSDIDFPPLSSQFKDIQLQLHATKVTNPYKFRIRGNKSFSGICELDKPSYVIAYGSEPWYYSSWQDASKVSDLIIINGGVKFSIKNAIDLENMFYNCIELTSLDLSNFNTSNVTDMGYMFYGCSALETLDYSLTGFEANGIVPDLSRCTNLKTLRLHHVGSASISKFIEQAKPPSACNVTQVS